jgi:hypothetical protein
MKTYALVFSISFFNQLFYKLKIGGKLMSDLIPYYDRSLDEDQFSQVPVDPYFRYHHLPWIRLETNQYDVDSVQSINQAKIELAKIFENINRDNLKAQIIQTRENARAQTYQCAVNGFFNGLPYLEKKPMHTLRIRDGEIPLFGSKPRTGFMVEID